MITSPQSYEDILEGIKNSNPSGDITVTMVNPDTEPIFKVDLNKRTITIPKELQIIAVEGDHNAETIYFETDRYFDNYDLSDLVCVVQYINPENDEYLANCVVNTYLENENKIRFGWTITQNVTGTPGKVTFAIRFYKVENQEIVYSLNTQPATVTIADGLYLMANEEFNTTATDIEASLGRLQSSANAIREGLEQLEKANNYVNINNKPKVNGVELAANANNTAAELGLVDIDDIISRIQEKSSASVMATFNSFDNLLAELTDTTLNDRSKNAVQNKVVNAKFVEIEGNVNKKFQNLDTQFTTINDQFKDINDEFGVIREEIGNSVYIPIEIISFSNNVKTVEKGNTVTEITFNYSFNQIPNELVLSFNEEANYPSVESSSFTKTGLELKEDTIFTLVASDKKSHNEIMTSNIEFLNGVYYGSSSEPELYDNAFILALNKTLQKKHGSSFNTEALDSQYIYYCAPTAYGIPRLSVSGLVGGFEKVQTINFTNSYGYEESYDVYRSEYSNLGSTLVKVE